jgi:signal transduction histidine kinase
MLARRTGRGLSVSAQDFLGYVSQAIYLALFVLVTVRFIRRPGWASFDTFLFFAVIATLLVVGDAAQAFGFEGHPVLNVLTWVGVSALPFILLRLVDDFRPQPIWVMVTASVAFVIVSAIGVVKPQPWGSESLVVVVFVAALGLYASLGFLREARRSTGVTRRRMQAVAFGSGLLALVLLLAGVRVIAPDGTEWLTLVTQVIGLALVLSYYIGFAPPASLRRAWQEPTLRALLAEAPDLVRLADPREVANRLEDRAARATGADGAAIGLWDEDAQRIVFRGAEGDTLVAPGEFIAGRSFERQEPVFSGRAERDAPEHADTYERTGIHAIAAAPISTDDRRLGVLVVYAARPPLFTDDVLSLIALMSEQAALVLRSQQLLHEAAQVRAMAEVTRLKDDFLSVVAHDVRTPLTAILLNAELLERGMPDEDLNSRRARSLRTEALRLKQLVEDYLDVVRSDHQRSERRADHDLAELVQEAILETVGANGRVSLNVDGAVPGSFDGPRIQQLVQNLVSNALKYSESEAEVEVGLAADDEWATLTVSDRGIGIPESDLAVLFERFHRGQNTDDRRYGGLGLGLYICRQVAEEHGGSIDAKSRVGEGTTFTVRLRRWSQAAQPPPAAADEPSTAALSPDVVQAYPDVPPSIAEVPGEATT